MRRLWPAIEKLEQDQQQFILKRNGTELEMKGQLLNRGDNLTIHFAGDQVMPYSCLNIHLR